jgi:hypothetical protein
MRSKIELRAPSNWKDIQETIDKYDLTIGEMVYLSITMIDMCIYCLEGVEKDILKEMLINHFKDNDGKKT